MGDHASPSSSSSKDLSRMDPDSVLAHDADRVLGTDTESSVGGSRRGSVPGHDSFGSSEGNENTEIFSSSPKANRNGTRSNALQEAIQMTPKSSQSTLNANSDEMQKLRAQIEDLNNQVTGLNTKLVGSFHRISDLEDDLSDTRERLMAGSSKVTQLEKEREEHLAALNTGLLVEKAHVSSEMTRMMDRVIEETKQRGQAESEKAKIESELDELSASLFGEANRMVAVERLARARAEEKSKQMEERLQDTEGIMLEQQKVLGDAQRELDALKAGQADKSGLSGQSNSFESTAQPGSSGAMTFGSSDPRQDQRLLMLDIVPYQELRAFLNHLRKQRLQLAPFYNWPYEPPNRRPGMSSQRSLSYDITPGSPVTLGPGPSSGASQLGSGSASTDQLPSGGSQQQQMSPFAVAGLSRHKDYPTLPSNCEALVHLPSQLSLPFIKRAQEEDCEPCLRLDFAPGLNWLSRRQANTSVLEGNLIIEPIFPGGVVSDEAAVRQQNAHLPPAACAMCGLHLVNVPLPGGDDVSQAKTPDLRTVSGWASSAANSIREAAGGSSTSTSPANPAHKASEADKAPALKSRSSGLFSSLASLRSKSGSPKPPVIDSTEEDPTETSSGAPAASTSTTAPLPQANAGPLPIPTHIFRLSETAATRYLLCPHHCLKRLRATCAFWDYLRQIERAVVLEGKLAWDDVTPAPSQAAAAATSAGEDNKKITAVDAETSEEAGETAKEESVEATTDNADVSTDTMIVKPPADEDNPWAASDASQEDKKDDDDDSHLRPGRPSGSTTHTRASSVDAGSSEGFHDAAEGNSNTDSPPIDKKSLEEGETDNTASSSQTADKPVVEPLQAAQSISRSDAASPSLTPRPAVPPRRTRPIPPPPGAAASTSNAPIPPPLPSRPSASRQASVAPPAPAPASRRFLRLDGTVVQENEDSTGATAIQWEEKVYLQVHKLKQEMWDARLGLLAGSSTKRDGDKGEAAE